eukprot:6327429-Pyramimonas_sp.AAC.2
MQGLRRLANLRGLSRAALQHDQGPTSAVRGVHACCQIFWDIPAEASPAVLLRSFWSNAASSPTASSSIVRQLQPVSRVHARRFA